MTLLLWTVFVWVGWCRRAVSLVLVVGLLVWGLSAGSDAGAVAGYGDVAAGRYFTEPVQWSVDEEITGLDGACFDPDAAVSRGDVAVYVWNMEGSPRVGVPAHSFGDVAAGGDVGAAVSWMVHNGITTGTTEATFSPDDTLTRAQVVTFLWRLAGKPSAPAHSFGDVSAGWQQGPVSWAAHEQITTGTTAKTFTPDAPLTRAQVVTFLWRYNNKPTVTVDPASPACEPDAPAFQSVAAGRCSAELSGGIYDWEQCAWSGFLEKPQFHKALSDAQADELIGRIWHEVQVEGKPAEAPTSELVPAGSECAVPTATGVIIGCYSRADHNIRRLDSFNDTLLHEVAHALVGGHPTVLPCAAILTNDAYQTCVHNDIFRCVTDYLYVRYAAIPTAGVCNKTLTDEFNIGGPPPAWREFQSVSASLDYSCGVRRDGTVTCWGYSAFLEFAGTFQSVSAGFAHSCGVLLTGAVTCRGTSILGVDFGQSDAPGGSFRSVSAGGSHSCGVRTDGTVACWGDNDDGQTDAPEGSFRSVAAGGSHSCGVRTDGTVACWGDNDYGQTDAPEGSFRSVAAGWLHSCGVRVDNTVACWGDNNSGWPNRDDGRAVAPEGSFRSVAAGLLHSCGVRVDNTVACWGDNDYGQTDAPEGSFRSVAAGWLHSCGVRVDNTVACWGDNDDGQSDAP